jgi:hypothetical protein
MITDKFFENVAKFKYLGKAVTNQSCVNEKVEQTKVRDCLLTFRSESFVFPPLL